MKKLLFLLSFLLVSCDEYRYYEEEIHELAELKKTEKQKKVPEVEPLVQTQEVKIRFLEFEASTFEVSVVNDKTTNICIGFFRADDVDCNGKIKTGKCIIRLQKIPVSEEEIIEHYGCGGVELSRDDGSRHLIKFILPE